MYNLLIPEMPKINPPTSFTRTVPLMPKPYDLYKLKLKVQALQDAKRKMKEANSFLDIGLNMAAHQRVAEGKWYEKIPGLNYALSSAELSWELVSKMFNLAKPGEALLANLHNFGETLDVVANLVKAPLYAWSSGGEVTVADALKMAYGLGDEGQRTIDFSDINKNVDWIPDGFAIDLVGEILSDPVNWATFGAYAIGKSALVSGGKTSAGLTAKYAFRNVNKIVGHKIDDAIKLASGTVTDPNNVEAIVKEAAKELTGKLGASQEVIEAGVRYAINQAPQIKKITSLTYRNIGGYVHRLNTAAFRNDYNEFAKILLETKNPNYTYTIKQIKEMFEHEQIITGLNKTAKFGYMVDEIENKVIKSVWKTTPAGIVHSGYRRYLKRPIKGFEEIVKDLEGASDTFDILDEAGFSTKSADELLKEWVTETEQLRRFVKNTPADTPGFDNTLEKMYQHLALTEKRYTIKKAKEVLGVKNIDLEDAQKNLDNVQKEILETEVGTERWFELVKQHEDLDKTIRSTRTYMNSRTMLKNLKTDFGANDYKTYVDYKQAKDLKQALDVILKGKDITNAVLELAQKYKLPIELPEKINESYIREVIALISNRMKRIDEMIALIDEVSYGGPQAEVIVRVLMSSADTRPLLDMQRIALEYKADAASKLLLQEKEMMEELNRLDSFIKFKNEEITKRYNELIKSPEGIEELKKIHPELKARFDELATLQKEFDSTSTDAYYKGIFLTIQEELPKITGRKYPDFYIEKVYQKIIHKDRAFLDNFYRTDKKSYNRIMSLLGPRISRQAAHEARIDYLYKRIDELKNSLEKNFVVKEFVNKEFDKFTWGMLDGVYKSGKGFVLPKIESLKVQTLFEEFLKYKNIHEKLKLEVNKEILERFKQMRSYYEAINDTVEKIETPLQLLETSIRQAIKDQLSIFEAVAFHKKEDEKYTELVDVLKNIFNGWAFVKEDGTVVNRTGSIQLTSRLYGTMNKLISITERTGLSEYTNGFVSFLQNFKKNYDAAITDIRFSEKVRMTNALASMKRYSDLTKETNGVFRPMEYLLRDGIQDLDAVTTSNGTTLRDIYTYINTPAKLRHYDADIDVAINELAGISKPINASSSLSRTDSILKFVIDDDFSIKILRVGGAQLLATYKIKALAALFNLQTIVMDGKALTQLPMDSMFIREKLVLEYMRDLLTSSEEAYAMSNKYKKQFYNSLLESIGSMLDFFSSKQTPKTIKEMSSTAAKKYLDAANQLVEGRMFELVIKIAEINKMGYSRIFKELPIDEYNKSLRTAIRNGLKASGSELELTDDQLEGLLKVFADQMLETSANAIGRMYENFNFLPNVIRGQSFESAIRSRFTRLQSNIYKDAKTLQMTSADRELALNDLEKNIIEPVERIYKVSRYRKDGTLRTIEDRFNTLKRRLSNTPYEREIMELQRSMETLTPMRELSDEYVKAALVNNILYRQEFEQLYTVIKHIKSAGVFHPLIMKDLIDTFDHDFVEMIFSATEKLSGIKISPKQYDKLKDVLGKNLRHTYEQLIDGKHDNVLFVYLNGYVGRVLEKMKVRIDEIRDALMPTQQLIRYSSPNQKLKYAGAVHTYLSKQENIDKVFSNMIFDSYYKNTDGLGIVSKRSNLEYVNGKPRFKDMDKLNSVSITMPNGSPRTRVYFDFETLRKNYMLENTTPEDAPPFQVSFLIVLPNGKKIRKSFFLELPDDSFKYDDKLQGRLHGISKKQYDAAPKYKVEDIRAQLDKYVEFDDDTIMIAHNAPYDLPYLAKLGYDDIDPIIFDSLPFMRSVNNPGAYENTYVELLEEAQLKITNLKKYKASIEKYGNKKDKEKIKLIDEEIEELLVEVKKHEDALEERNITGYSLEGLSGILSEDELKEVMENFKEYEIPEGILGQFHNAAYDVEVTQALSERFFINNIRKYKTIGDINSLSSVVVPEKYHKYLDDIDNSILRIQEIPLGEEDNTFEDTFKELLNELYLNFRSSKTENGVEIETNFINDIKNVKNYADMERILNKKNKIQDLLNSIAHIIETQKVKAQKSKDPSETMFTKYSDILDGILEADLSLEQIFNRMAQSHHLYMSAIYGNSVGYAATNHVINGWRIRDAWASSESIDLIRKLLKFKPIQSGNPLSLYSDYFTKGIMNALIEKEYKEVEKPLVEAITDADIKVQNKKRLEARIKFYNKKEKSLKRLSKNKLHELYRVTFPDSEFVKLENTMDLLDRDFEFQEEVAKIIMRLPFEKQGPLFSKVDEVMRATDKEFKLLIMEYSERIAAGETEETVMSILKSKLTTEYFGNVLEAKWGAEIKASQYGDIINMYLEHTIKMMDSFATIDNRKYYSTIMNPDTRFSNYLHDVYKDNIMDAMAPILEYVTNVGDYKIADGYADIKEILNSALEDIRKPLADIKVESQMGELFPIYVGHFKKHLNNLSTDPELAKLNPWIHDIQSLGDLSRYSQKTFRYTKASKKAKQQTELVSTFLEGLRKRERKAEGFKFVEYASSDPSSHKFYKWLEETLGDAIHWVSSNNSERPSRITYVEKLERMMNFEGTPEFFKELKKKFDDIEKEFSNAYMKFKVMDFDEAGRTDPKQLHEFMQRIKGAYAQYLYERTPEEYRIALKQLKEAGFEKQLITQDWFGSWKYIKQYTNQNFDEIYKSFGSPEEFYKFLMNPDNTDYSLSYVVKDIKTRSGIRIKKFVPKSLEDLKMILNSPSKNDLMLLNNEQYQVFEKFARQKFQFKDDSVGDIIRRFMLMPMKSAMLLTTNFFFNNIVDINLKNLVAQEGGMFSAQSVLGDTVVAFKWFNIHNKLYNEAIDGGVPFHILGNKYDEKWIVTYRRFLEALGPLSDAKEEQFAIAELVQSFLRSPSAASEPADMMLRMQANLIGNDVRDVPFERFLNKVFYGSKYSPFRYNFEINSMAEVVGRLGLHINNIKKGLTMNESLLKILKTHFNYSNKSKAELYAEFVIPFASYPLRSFDFWPEALSYDNKTSKFLVDSLLTAWDRDKLDDNSYARYQFSRGNIPIGNSVIQTGLTFMDTLSAPFIGKNAPLPVPEQVTRKVNPLLKNSFQAFIGTMDKQEAFLRTPGISQVRNIYNTFTQEDKSMSNVLPSMADSYFADNKFVVRSSYMSRQHMFNRPYSFSNGQLKFKGQFDINKNAMRTLQWKYTEIRPLYNRL